MQAIYLFIALIDLDIKQGASLVGQWVKNLPANAGAEETWVWSVGREDPLE